MTAEVIAALDAIVDGFDDETSILSDIATPLEAVQRALIAGAKGSPLTAGESLEYDAVVRGANGEVYISRTVGNMVLAQGDESIADLDDADGQILFQTLQDITSAIWYAHNDSYKALSFASAARDRLKV